MTIFRFTPRDVRSRIPWRDLERLRGQMEGVFEALADGVDTIRQGGGAGVYPLLNLAEDTENLYLFAEMPGVDPADLELSVQAQSVTLRGERKPLETENRVNYHRRERDSGVFRRVVDLPVRIDTEGVSAAASNGILKVTLPKASEARARSVSIQSE